MERTAKRLGERSDRVSDVCLDAVGVARRHDDVLGEAAVAVHSQVVQVLTEVRPSGSTEPALPADDAGLDDDVVARRELFDPGAGRFDQPRDLVPERTRQAPAAVQAAAIDVQIGLAESAGPDLDEHLAGARIWRQQLTTRHRANRDELNCLQVFLQDATPLALGPRATSIILLTNQPRRARRPPSRCDRRR